LSASERLSRTGSWITGLWTPSARRTWRYFREGKIKEIADYCETDVVGTYQVWLRYELFRGHVEPAGVRDERAELSGFHERAVEASERRYEGILYLAKSEQLSY
jgi:predicted PolB exonuclease-like 3'-5' exonuclease